VSPADFAGTWRIARVISDQRAGQTGRFDGQALLSPAGRECLDYVETGSLLWGEAPALTATRRYRWAFKAGLVLVSFDDGRPFHSFSPTVGGAGTDHLCGQDLYRVRYGFADWPVWTAVWQVLGPRKDYSLNSRYWR
jgi:Family of unknown function (DUF6314)